MEHGVRNSLLVAPAYCFPQILGNNEAFEPYTSNIYTRRVLSGEFIVVNKHLLHDLVDLGLWNETMKQELMRNNGSVQDLDIPQTKVKKTVWSMILSICHVSIYFVDQSQSLNLFIKCKLFDINAFLCMAVWTENWNVLLENKGGS
jgi:ribonucleoside-diphosphate reductase alpha chain